MKIAHIVPGSGGTFYCQNCLRDSSLVRELQVSGLDVTLVPMYLPLYGLSKGLPEETPVFFGGINVYLQQKFSVFRRTPRWLDRVFDSRWMLGMAAKNAGSTDAAQLGDMTISMLRGEEGRQKKEVDRLIAWLGHYGAPDIVHLSNALLIGLAGPLRRRLGARVVCSLQDEHVWIDAMKGSHAAQAWRIVEEASADVDAFVAVSAYYRDRIRERIDVPAEKFRVIHIGLPLEAYEAAVSPANGPVIGYLSRLSPNMGFDILLDAFFRLKESGHFPGLRLKATGGIVGEDRQFADELCRRISARNLTGSVVFTDSFDAEDRIAFLRSLSLLSVPIPEGEAFGMFIVESLACGVPVVQPDAGAFPEIVQRAGGGVIYSPNTPENLSDRISDLLERPVELERLSREGRAGVREYFSISRMAREMITLYEDVIV